MGSPRTRRRLAVAGVVLCASLAVTLVAFCEQAPAAIAEGRCPAAPTRRSVFDSGTFPDRIAVGVWLAFCAAFALPFLSRPLRLLHLDVAVLIALSLSYGLFTANSVESWVPLAALLLVYLLVRMICLALRRTGPRGTFRPAVPLSVLAVGAMVLLGFRLGLAIQGGVTDVGYAGVIGGHQLLHGEPVYGTFPADNPHGDTYGPVLYYAYVPFVATFPWSGCWDALPASHAATIAFDVLCIVLLWLVGNRLGGRVLGVLLAYLWLAFPFTLLVVTANTSDALVAALVLLGLYVIASPVARGAAIALAGLTKFAPLALLPLFAAHSNGGRARAAALTLTAFGCVAAIAMTPVLVDVRPDVLWERTLGFQDARASPFSVWSLYGWETAQTVVRLGVVLFALSVAIWRRNVDVTGTAAISAAVLIATQLTIDHWFFLYIVWFLPLLMIAVLVPTPPSDPQTETSRSVPRAAAAHSRW